MKGTLSRSTRVRGPSSNGSKSESRSLSILRRGKGVTMNLKELKELIEMLKNSDISELEIERSGVKVRLRKGGDVTFHPSMPRMEYPPAAIIAPTVTEIPAAPPAEKAAEPVAAKTNEVRVTSPIVGTFYRSSSPDKPPYVEIGDLVKKG